MNRIFRLLIPAFAFSAAGFGQFAITTSGLPVATVNQGYSAAVQTNSSATAIACTIVSGALPGGISLQVNGTGCLISGIASVANSASFAMTVSNNLGQTTAAVSYFLPVFGITTPAFALPPGALNTSYNFQFQANGGTQYQWSVVSGALPPGLSLSSTGFLTGTLQGEGVFTFGLRVGELLSSLNDTRTYSITVSSTGAQFRIVQTSLPNGNVNQAYSATITTTGANGNLGFPNGCQMQGSSPPGISISAAGTSCILSGAPTSPGTFTFQVQAVDSQGRVTPVETFTITVSGSGGGSSGLNITTGAIPNGTTSVAYLPGGSVFTFTATGGTGIYSWFLDSGTLPSGLSLATNGALTGTPTQGGTFSFTIRVVAGGLLTSYQQTATRSFSMTVVIGGLTIVETSLPSATTGLFYSFQLHPSGGTPPYRWRLGTTDATGFNIDLNSGLISGTPLAPGNFTLPVTLSDNAGRETTVAYPLSVFAPFSITTNALADGATGIAYNASIQAAGGQTPYHWAITSGNLPPGLTLGPSGSISGLPAVNGQYTVTVTATDAAGRTASKIFTIQIGPPGPVQILTTTLPGGTLGLPYSQTLNASGGQPPYSWSVAAGTLPNGLNLSSTSGVILGTPTQGGSFIFTIQVNDAVGNTTARSFSLAIASTGIVVSPAQLTFNYAVGGLQPVAQQVTVSGTTVAFTAASNVSWLSVSQSASATPAILTIAANPSGLGAGTYNGTVTVTPSGSSSPAQVISVTLVISVNSGLSVSPPALTFTYASGGALPLAQTVTIASSATGLSYAASASGGSWLQVSPQNGNIPAILSVSVNPFGLAQGVYTGAITILGAGVSQQVPVTLTVLAGQAPTLTLSVSSLTFNYEPGGPQVPTQFVTVNSIPRLSFSATATGSPWLRVTPDVGLTPASLFVSVNPAGLAPATYTGTIVITTTGPTGNTFVNLPVTLNVAASGGPVVTTVVNSASYATGQVAPGEIVAIGGSGLGPATPLSLTLDQAGKVSTSLGGVQVFFNTTPAPLIYVSANQINAVVPYEVAGQLSVLVTVRFQGRSAAAYPVAITFSAPGLFTLNASGTGPGAILNQDGTTNSPSQPVRKGQYVTLYLTGEGQTAPPGVTGSVTVAIQGPQVTPRPILPVSVFVAGQSVPLSFVGEAPGIVAGVLQVNALIPQDAASGDLPIEVSVGANRSQSGVTVSVQ